MPVIFTPTLIDQIIKGRCADFAATMGMRKTKSGELQVTVFLPGATAVEVVQRNGKKVLGALAPLHAEGLFSGVMPGKKTVPYKLRVQYGDTVLTQDDPYRFPSRLDKAEMQLFVQGQHDAAWQLLGAQRCTCDDVEGVQFVLWAPTAQRVSLVCELNGWDGRRHVLRRHHAFGLWELFVPGFVVADNPDGGLYKFEILTADQRYQSLPFDPFAREVSTRPVFCTRIAAENSHVWLDNFWQQVRRDFSGQGSAVAIREVAIDVSVDDHKLNWKQLVPLLLQETRSEGFTHVLLTARFALAVSEQHTVYGLLAPDPALGSPDDLRTFIDQAHEMELGVMWDVPLLSLLYSLCSGNPPLALLQPQTLDGPLLSILLGYFSFWRESFHIDGFRVRDIDELLSLQPASNANQLGGKKRESKANGNAFIKEWLSQLMQKLRALHPGLLMIVETSAQKEQFSSFTDPAHKGGLGFDYRIAPSDNGKPDADVLDSSQTIGQLLSSLQDGNRDQIVLSLPWQQLGNTATFSDPCFAVLMLALWTLPGRKHLQRDCILRQAAQWNPEAGHDWELQKPDLWPDDASTVLRELNQLYQSSPCLYEVDGSHEGISLVRNDGAVFAWERKGRHVNDVLLIVINTGNERVETEITPSVAGQYQLRYQTPSPEHAAAASKVVQSATCSASGSTPNHWQKLVLTLPACSGAVYAWQG